MSNSTIKRGSKLTVTTDKGITNLTNTNNIGIAEISGPVMTDISDSFKLTSITNANLPQLRIGTTDSSGSLQLGVFKNSNNKTLSILQSSFDSSTGDNDNIKGYNHLTLQPKGGNLGIRTNDPLAIFDINNMLLIDPVIGYQTDIGHNVYDSTGFGSYKNIFQGPSSQIQLAGGQHNQAYISFRLSNTNVDTSSSSGIDTQITEALRIVQSGNIGIGTGDPVSKLDVNLNSSTVQALTLRNGNGNAINNGAQIAFSHLGSSSYKHFIHTRHAANNSNLNAIDFYVCDGTTLNTLTSGSNHLMTLDGSGNVGIGTTNPSYNLHIHNSNIPYIHLTNSTTGTTNNDGTSISLYQDDLYIRNREDGGNIKIQTKDGSTEPMTILAGGNVGIGTTNAWRNLHLHNPSTGPVYFRLSTNESYNSGQNNDSGFDLALDLRTVTLINRENGPINFRTNNSFRMTIAGDGNIGIGTTNPTQSNVWSGSAYSASSVSTLDVYGKIRFGTDSNNNMRSELGGTYSNAGLFLGCYNTDNGVGDYYKLKAYMTTSANYPAGFIVTGYNGGDTGLAFGVLDTNTSTSQDYTTKIAMLIKEGGNVGIGTNDANTPLHVDGTAQARRFQIHRNGHTSWSEAPGGTNSTEDGHDAYLWCTKNLSASASWPFSGNDLGSLVIQPRSTSARDIIFRHGGDSHNIKMIIDRNGKVGIGTAFPAEKLHIHGEGETYNAIMISGATNTGEGIEIMSRSEEGQTGGFIHFIENAPEKNYGFALGFNGGADNDLWNWKTNTFNIQYFNDSTTGGTALTIKRENGNVGIGTNEPRKKLNVQEGNDCGISFGKWTEDSTNDTAGIWFSSTSGHMNNITPNTPHIYSYRSHNDDRLTFTSVGGHEFKYITGDEYRWNHIGTDNLAMKITSSGTVGIGTYTPIAKLHVQGVGSTQNIGGRAYLDANSTPAHYTSSSSSGTFGIYASGAIWSAGHVFSTSDMRIKENIRDVSDTSSLQTLRDISCVYYEYRDKISKGSDTTIGFIAQQVKEHMPMAVSIQSGIIPNEMRVITDYSWNTILYDNDDNIITERIYDESGNDITIEKYKLTIHDLSDNSGNIENKFYVSNDPSGNDECEKNIFTLSNETSSFIFDESWNHIFLYGNQVDDLNILDKDKLFALNFSATQEIDKQQQADKLRIATLEAEVTSLKSQITSILQRLDNGGL